MYAYIYTYIYICIKRYLKYFLPPTLSKNYVSGQWWKSCILNCLLARPNEQRSSRKTVLIGPDQESL